MATYRQQLEDRRSAGLYRQLTTADDLLVDFHSNDYLGYARLLSEGNIIHDTPVSGSTGSRLISGNHLAHEHTERLLAQYFNSESALLFPSGYQANIGVLSCLPQRNDVMLFDEEIHASMRDGIRLGFSRAYSFAHNDMVDLEEKLRRHRGDGQCFLAMETLYSMSGDLPDMNRLMALKEKYDLFLILDEAHSVGITGPENKGPGMIFGKSKDVVRIITFGKAFGYCGAAVLCSGEIRDYLINFSRPFIYTTAPALNAAKTIDALVRFHMNDHENKALLNQVIHDYTTMIKHVDFPYEATRNPGPVQYVRVGDNHKTMELEERWRIAGIGVKGIRTPTVAAGRSGLRVSLHAFNTREQLALLLHPSAWNN